jgi:predicted DCC family thiol-disulfide oxidoreductase YuxK
VKYNESVIESDPQIRRCGPTKRTGGGHAGVLPSSVVSSQVTGTAPADRASNHLPMPNFSEQARASAFVPHVVLYDGDCGVCNAWVRFVLEHDSSGIFHFAAVQSPIGRIYLAGFDIAPAPLTTVYVVVSNGSRATRLLTKSDAALFVLTSLGWPWTAATALRVLPRAWLDAGYDLVARYRHRLWRQRDDVCLVLSPEHRARMLDTVSERGSNTEPTL